MHGGKAAQVTAAGQRKLAENRLAVELVEALGADLDPVDQAEALVEMVAVAYRKERWLRGRVAELEEVFGATFHSTGNATGEAKPHVLWVMHREAAGDCARFADLALRAGVNERAVQVLEREADVVVALIRAILDDPELGVSDRDAANRVVHRHLAALGAA